MPDCKYFTQMREGTLVYPYVCKPANLVQVLNKQSRNTYGILEIAIKTPSFAYEGGRCSVEQGFESRREIEKVANSRK